MRISRISRPAKSARSAQRNQLTIYLIIFGHVVFHGLEGGGLAGLVKFVNAACRVQRTRRMPDFYFSEEDERKHTLMSCKGVSTQAFGIFQLTGDSTGPKMLFAEGGHARVT